MLSVYLIAGEASGDALGAGLMRALREQTGGLVRFTGIGGELMAAEDLQSLFPYHQLSLMGFAEIVPHLIPLIARINQVVEDIHTKRPDAVVTIDSPGFNFRIAARLRKDASPLKLIHYVAPTVWAYKPKRAKKCAKLFDTMLCLLPFEPPYFESQGMRAAFVGHPVAYRCPGDGARFRQKYELHPTQPLLCMMPGSREGELLRHMPIFSAALTLLAPTLPDMALAVPTSKRLLPTLAEWFEGCPFRAVLLTDPQDKQDAFAAAHAALVKSGTSSLEVAQAGVPQVVAYRVNPLTAWLLKRMIRVPYASLVNLLAEQEVIPELLQERCTPEFLAEALSSLLRDPDTGMRQRQTAAQTMTELHAPGGATPEILAAKAILNTLS